MWGFHRCGWGWTPNILRATANWGIENQASTKATKQSSCCFLAAAALLSGETYAKEIHESSWNHAY